MTDFTPIIILIALIGGGLFYWFEWRLKQIREECSKSDGAIIPAIYQKCLHENGL
jgi:hypothetical protein